MRTFLIYFSLFTFNFSLAAQQDSGFTNRDSAKNLKVNGVKEGKWVENLPFHAAYYVLTIYKAGKAWGKVRQYYPNGKLCLESTYVDGKKNGLERAYSKNGQLVAETPFINNQINGIEKDYFVSADYRTIMYKNGKKKEMPPQDSLNGTLIVETSYVNGKGNGLQKQFYRNGKVQFETTYTDNII
jgi:antitoxin component YwqK of YwqJK toxin-antitoxin module